jgi:hypothetical protein
MADMTTSNRSWLAIASFVISLFALCTLPLPLIPSSFLGILGSVLGGIALWRIRRNGGENRDRLFAMGGIVMGIVPLISFCITVTLLAREIPRLITLLSTEISQLSAFLSREIPRFLALLSNLFR